MKDQELLEEAAEFAVKKLDRRTFRLAALGRRADGALVRAKNEAVVLPTPSAHAEARLCQKLDVGADVWICRVLRCGEWGLAKPCIHCLKALRLRGVKRVCYTTGPKQYEVMFL